MITRVRGDHSGGPPEPADGHHRSADGAPPDEPDAAAAVRDPDSPVVPRTTKRLQLDPSISREDIEAYLALKRAVEEKRQREERERQDAALTRLRASYDGPLDLMIAMHPGWVRTPALQVISEAFERTVATPGARVIVTMSPQEGKSQSVQAASLRALQHNPDCRIAYASYAEWLARRNSGEVRDLIQQYGTGAVDSVSGDPLPDLLGFGLNPDRSAEGRWQLGHGHHGGAVAVGLTSGLTGAAVDLLIVDDPVKDQQAADSEVIRTRLHEWWASVAETRLAPHTSIIVIQTRWHEQDLAGRLIDEDLVLPEEMRQWKVINIPALADGQTPDALDGIPEGRDDHGWMVSARGDRVPMWTSIQAKRPRVFSAMYQGRPAPLEGGIFQTAWFDDHRVSARPEVILDRVVGVDPADTGTGDAAGILVAEVGADGHSYWIADLSGQLSQAEWARRVCLAWLRYEAHRIVQEKNMGMRNSVHDAWSLILRQAVALVAWGEVERASAELAARGDSVAADQAGIREIAEWAEAIVAVGENGPRVETVNPKLSKTQRAESATQPFQDGRAHIVGHLPALEHEACFPAGTMVATARGDVPIEQVTTTDRVWTRQGWKRVLWSGQTKVAQCATLHSAAGHRVRATYDHRVWTEQDGWISMNSLVPGHRITTCPNLGPARTSSSRESSTHSTSTGTGRPARLAVASSGSSTATSGRTRTDDPSLTGTTSTMTITTRPTTTRRTSWPSRTASTPLTTPLIGAGRSGLPSNALRSDEPTGPGASRPSEPVSTLTAGARSGRPDSAPSTAQCSAGWRRTASGSSSGAGSATTPTLVTSSTNVRRVDPPNGAAVPVYDLTVEDAHEFFADGILVHNCVWQVGQKSPNRLDTLSMIVAHFGRTTGRSRVLV